MSDSKVRTSAEVEVRHSILEPETVKVVDKILEQKHDSDERLRNERRDRESYVAPDGDTNIMQDKSAAQRGRSLQAREVMKRLKRMNPALHFERAIANPDIWGIYVVENRPDPITNHSPWKRHVCGLPDGDVWEFHRPLVLEEDIPEPDGLGTVKTVKIEGHVPGWRMVLLRLIMDGQITPAQAEAGFHITQGRSSQKWQLGSGQVS